MSEQDDLYSPAYFQGLLEAERGRVVERLGGNGSFVPAGFIDELVGAESDDRPQIVAFHSALVQGEWKRLHEIDEALKRINSGTYGKCLDCGKPILSARLAAIPVASLCVQCHSKHKENGTPTPATSIKRSRV